MSDPTSTPYPKRCTECGCGWWEPHRAGCSEPRFGPASADEGVSAQKKQPCGEFGPMAPVNIDLDRWCWKVPVLQDDNTIRYITPNSDPMVHEYPADFYANSPEELVRYTEAVGLEEDAKEWVMVHFTGEIEFTPGSHYHEGEWDTCHKCSADIWLVAGKWRTWVKGLNCTCNNPVWVDYYNAPCCTSSYWGEECTTGVHYPEPDD